MIALSVAWGEREQGGEGGVIALSVDLGEREQGGEGGVPQSVAIPRVARWWVHVPAPALRTSHHPLLLTLALT